MLEPEKRQPQSVDEGKVFLKTIREQLNMTQVQFAVALGVDPSTISRCERGLSEICLTILEVKRFCKLVNMNLEDLPDYLGKPPQPKVANASNEELEEFSQEPPDK